MNAACSIHYCFERSPNMQLVEGNQASIENSFRSSIVEDRDEQ